MRIDIWKPGQKLPLASAPLLSTAAGVHSGRYTFQEPGQYLLQVRVEPPVQQRFSAEFSVTVGSWPKKELAALLPEADSWAACHLTLGDKQCAQLTSVLGRKVDQSERTATCFMATRKLKSGVIEPLGMIWIGHAQIERSPIGIGLATDMSGIVTKTALFGNHKAKGLVNDKVLEAFVGLNVADSDRLREILARPEFSTSGNRAIANEAARGIVIMRW